MAFLLLTISMSLIVYGYHQPNTRAVVQVKRQARQKQAAALNVSNKQ
ncbi:hypothetical protein [Maritalea porphyrae]|jgi:hypothetical protein|nr:hypothetical protein [Maritalea porphyrae]MCZ4273572.1 hypothetical protein [Maritalea porphyrae]